ISPTGGVSSPGDGLLNTEWQSFTAGATGMLSKVSPALRNLSAPPFTQAVTMNIYNGEGTGGTLLYTMTQNVSITNATTLYDFVISGDVLIVKEHKYTASFTTSGTAISWTYSTGNPYPGGMSGGGSNVDHRMNT